MGYGVGLNPTALRRLRVRIPSRLLHVPLEKVRPVTYTSDLSFSSAKQDARERILRDYRLFGYGDHHSLPANKSYSTICHVDGNDPEMDYLLTEGFLDASQYFGYNNKGFVGSHPLNSRTTFREGFLARCHREGFSGGIINYDSCTTLGRQMGPLGDVLGQIARFKASTLVCITTLESGPRSPGETDLRYVSLLRGLIDSSGLLISFRSSNPLQSWVPQHYSYKNGKYLMRQNMFYVNYKEKQ